MPLINNCIDENITEHSKKIVELIKKYDGYLDVNGECQDLSSSHNLIDLTDIIEDTPIGDTISDIVLCLEIDDEKDNEWLKNNLDWFFEGHQLKNGKTKWTSKIGEGKNFIAAIDEKDCFGYKYPQYKMSSQIKLAHEILSLKNDYRLLLKHYFKTIGLIRD